jgi:hypothetical protein
MGFFFEAGKRIRKMSKTFRLTLEVSANPDLTEKEMFRRFEEFIDAIPKSVNQLLFKTDCCLVNIIAEEQLQ